METKLATAVHDMTFSPRDRIARFLALPREERAQVFAAFGVRVRRDVVTHLRPEDLVPLLEDLDPDEATDAIQLLPKGRQKAVIGRLKESLRDDVEVLRQFDPQTAAGLMTLDYVNVDEGETIADAAKRFEKHERRTGRPPTIVATRDGKAVGALQAHRMAFAQPDEQVSGHASHLLSVRHDAHRDEVLHLFRHHPHNRIAVLGDHGQVLGIIYSDDVIRALRERESASLYDFAGVHEEESVGDPARVKVRFRYKWLVLNLMTAFIAASVVGLFEETIAKYVLLAVYMPIVAGMGGNAGTQTLAVMVRGITLRQVSLRSALPTLARELGAAAMNGLINGVIVATVVYAMTRETLIAIVLGIAMVSNLLVAAFFGTLVPLVLQRFGKDPATSATVFITTATDVLGFTVFLGLATLLLK